VLRRYLELRGGGGGEKKGRGKNKKKGALGFFFCKKNI